MSDFDEVLERLLTEPSFASALAADPTAALAGYSLGDDERDVLRAQLVSGSGGERVVEDRTTKSGVVGLLGPVAAAFGMAAGAGAQSATGSAGTQTLGTAAGGGHSLGAAPGGGSFGAAPQTDGVQSLGGASGAAEYFGVAGSGGQGSGAATGSTSVGGVPVEATDYHTRVDVDGDGSWDAYTAYERADGGVDIHVDADRDGRTDFIGHDYDRDRLVDVADFDRDQDGLLETRMYDDTGDGWMDRSEPLPTDPTP